MASDNPTYPTLTVRVRRQIHSSCSAVSTEDFFVERMFTLPAGLQPFNGLVVSWQAPGQEYATYATLNELSVKEAGELTAYDHADRTLYELHARGMKSGGLAYHSPEGRGILRFLVEQHIDEGWAIVSDRDRAKLDALPPALDPDERPGR